MRNPRSRRSKVAKGDVTMKFDATTAAFLQDLAKAREAMLAAGDASRKMGNDTKHGGDLMKDALGGVVEELGLITSVAGAAAAGVKLVLSTAEDMMARMEARAANLKGRVSELSGGLAATGSLDKFTLESAQIAALASKKVGGAEFSEKELGHAATEIRRNLGMHATQSQIAKSLGTYQKAIAGSSSVEGAIGIATQEARLSKFGLEDMATDAARYGLTESDMVILNRTKTAGGDVREAANLMLAVHQNEEKMRPLLSATQKGKKTIGQVVAEAAAHPGKKLHGEALDLQAAAAELKAHPGQSLEGAIKTTEHTAILEHQMFERNTEVRDQKNKEGQRAYEDLDFTGKVDRLKVDVRKNGPDWLPDWAISAGGQAMKAGKVIDESRLGQMANKIDPSARGLEVFTSINDGIRELIGHVITQPAKNNTSNLDANGRDEGRR